MILKYRNVLALVMVFFAFSTCVEQTRSASVWNNGKYEAPLRDLDVIRREGKLRVVVDYNFINYFVYKGKPMGFKYEILKHLADDLDVKLELHVSNDLEETFRGLETGRFDLAARNLTVSSDRQERVDFTMPLFQTRQVLVQKDSGAGPDNHYVASHSDLAGKSVTVVKNSVFVQRLNEIESEIGNPLVISEDSVSGIEQLISMVANGEADYTVCDEKVAGLFLHQYSNLDVSLPLSDVQQIAWAVRKNTYHLREYLNDWLKNFMQSARFEQLEKKYYNPSRSLRRANSEYFSLADGKISPFDEIIRREARIKGWDWRLIAAIIYQESRFEPEASSWAGASGLMQLMPETARSFGVTDINHPAENIRAGIQLLSWLDSQLKSEIPDQNERLKFVLASYNVGLGHVKDAQRLAGKYGKDPFRWVNNVDYYLLNKSISKYYNDPVSRWGYARGKEPFEFVTSVLNYYGHYRNVIPE